MAAGKRSPMRATSRDPEEWARATEKARAIRELAAGEVALVIGEQVAELVVAGDIMGGRAMVADRIRKVAAAEQRGERDVLRAAWMELAVAAAACVASIDYVPPASLNGSSGAGDAAA